MTQEILFKTISGAVQLVYVEFTEQLLKHSFLYDIFVLTTIKYLLFTKAFKAKSIFAKIKFQSTMLI